MSIKPLKYFLLTTVLFSVVCVSAQEKNIQQQYDSIAEIIAKTRDKDSVLSLLNLQKELAQKATNKKLLADTEYNIAIKSNYAEDESIEHFQKALALYRELKDTPALSKTHVTMGRAYQSQSKYNEAFKSVNEALQYAKAINDQELLINAYSFRSNIYGNFSQTDNAIKDLNEAQIIALQYKDGEKLLPILQAKGFLYYSKGYYKEGIAALKEMIAHFDRKNNKRSVVVWRNNLGMIYASCNCVSLDEQKENMHASIALADSIKFGYGKAYASVHLARALMKENAFDSAYYHLAKADKGLPKKVNPSFTGYLNQTKGDYWANLGNKQNAIKYFEIAYKIWDKLNKLKDKEYVAKGLATLYKDSNKSDKAFFYLDVSAKIKDSMVNKAKIENEKELELTYAFDKKQYKDSIQNAETLEVLALQKENEVQAEKHVQQILFGLFILALALGGFAYYAYQRKKKISKVLDEKNKIIEKALQEKQLLLKEVHHRVKNNFQIVSSLLELQTKGIEDEKALNLANEGKNRVKSMALIHQKLYQNETGLIDFDEYIRVLVKELSSMYASEKKVQTNINTENMYFDVDTAIPLGLIVNELITNAYKYAFDASTDNQLNIAIAKLNEEEYKLTVSDNGKGIDGAIDLSKVKSLGLRLVKRLTKQLHGSFVLNNIDGATFEITFKDTHTRALLD
ncbi:tetratricopeptide repeat protein [Kordia sp. YSTF-M3]|uniref:histidine kinase n=1 Tax=Kordia aestuariivivens TaxID=2759037 RepID=A0ABR7Q794_9FLAO|nr:histidine kinase dimerization/phosphoacceptor domain -containing protein [Kordia aestuariivivens]MBC8754442.1 tetratricopeptide repeat protein [Kordia aestuariivivens]